MDKIEQAVDKIIVQFESKPIATTLKGLIILYVIKEAAKWFKSN